MTLNTSPKNTKYVFVSTTLGGYFFDIATDTMYSTKSGQALPLKWFNGAHDKSVNMSMDGMRITYTLSQIKRYIATGGMVPMCAEVATEKETQFVSDFDAIAPDYEFVMFSAKNKCSQYFFAGTTVGYALSKFAKRGEVIAAQDIRIVNVTTGKISTLGIRKVEQYALV